MKSANGIPFSYILALFEHGEYVDETNFWFNGESEGDQHYLGYLPQFPESPYWAGYCDLNDGFECTTAEALFNAPYYDGKSLKERWQDVHINEIGLVPVELLIKYHNDEFPFHLYE